MAPSKKVKSGGFTPEEEATPLGAPHPAPITTDPSTIPNPYRTQEEQLVEMKPAIVGPPGYGSPDPNTNLGRLVPLNEHPLRDTDYIGESYGEGYGANLTPLETLSPSPGPGTGEDEDSEGDERVTAAAQKLADENGVNVDEVDGTGADGRVTKSDVQSFIDERDAADND